MQAIYLERALIFLLFLFSLLILFFLHFALILPKLKLDSRITRLIKRFTTKDFFRENNRGEILYITALE